MLTKYGPQIVSVALIFMTAIAALFAQGRIWWCKIGDLSPYVNQAWNSNHTSQHLLTPYAIANRHAIDRFLNRSVANQKMRHRAESA